MGYSVRRRKSSRVVSAVLSAGAEKAGFLVGREAEVTC